MFAVHHRAALACTFGSFTTSVPGYLHIVLGLRRSDDILEPFISEGIEYSILSGWYRNSWAPSVLIENEIDGLIMDTTWNVMGQYVTAMLMAVFFNVGIPLALAFRPGETKDLYSMFTRVF
jgi:hypothetical protein